jgi:signal transduction histidine kinase
MTAVRPTPSAPRAITVDRMSPLLTRQMRPVDLVVGDVALAALVVAPLCVYAAMEAPVGGGHVEPVWLSVLIGALVGLPVGARRRWPVLVSVLVTSTSAIALLTRVIPDYAAAAPAFAIGFVFYLVGLTAPELRSVLVAIGGLGVMALSLIMAADGLWSGLGAVVYAAVMIFPAWVAGWLIRERRAHAARFRTQLVREAATEERLRLARELHDIVGHTMSLIVVKASVAVHVAEQRPEEALDALRVIEATSRAALDETRGLLADLRDEAALAPISVDDLRDLASRAAAGGVEVRLDVHPEVFGGESVSPPVARSTYRIVQEALTNVVKHAAPAVCEARVDLEDGRVRIDVVDDGRRPPSSGTSAGHGLIGIRERAGLHGGSFTAGPRPGGGFEVRVLLPVRATL